MTMTGSRELEMILFGLKETLIEIHLGQWAYDDLIIYMAEMCKKLEIIEINSDHITDTSVTAIFRKSKYLKVLDVAGCPNFVGGSFADAKEEDGLAALNLRRICLG